MSNLNSEFEAELAALQDHKNSDATVKVFDTPNTEIEKSRAVDDLTDEQLFGSTAQDNRIPSLNQAFVIQKSNMDKATELGQLAQEMYEEKKISRTKIVTMESMARELIPATEDDIGGVIVSDHEVNMFTEEPTGVELQNATGATQAALDRVTSQLRTTAIELGKTLISTGKKYQNDQTEVIEKSVSVFKLSSFRRVRIDLKLYLDEFIRVNGFRQFLFRIKKQNVFLCTALEKGGLYIRIDRFLLRFQMKL